MGVVTSTSIRRRAGLVPTREDFARLARPARFCEGETRFVGVVFRLALEKGKRD